MPDDELLALAGKGQLTANLDAQVRRMLASKKADALVDNFAGQWLQLRSLKAMAPDPDRFPGFDDELRAAATRDRRTSDRYTAATSPTGTASAVAIPTIIRLPRIACAIPPPGSPTGRGRCVKNSRLTAPRPTRPTW
jgi:hypothetical protein